MNVKKQKNYHSLQQLFKQSHCCLYSILLEIDLQWCAILKTTNPVTVGGKYQTLANFQNMRIIDSFRIEQGNRLDYGD